MLAAAKRLFVDRGFGGTSLRDIAAEAGYTQGAFYSNFASKEELFVELMRERSQTQVADIARVLSDPDASGEDILTALEVWSRTVDAGPSGRCWVSSSSFRGGATRFCRRVAGIAGRPPRWPRLLHRADFRAAEEGAARIAGRPAVAFMGLSQGLSLQQSILSEVPIGHMIMVFLRSLLATAEPVR